jgi:hypothetical protein
MKDRRTTRDWRARLTGPEKKRLAAIEKELATLDAKNLVLRAERNRIQNRATVRAGK